MREVEELEARRAKLEARLAEIKRRQKIVEQAAAARHASAERKADTHRKCVLAGTLLLMLRSNPQLLDFLRRSLPPLAAEKDRAILLDALDSLGPT